MPPTVLDGCFAKSAPAHHCKIYYKLHTLAAVLTQVKWEISWKESKEGQIEICFQKGHWNKWLLNSVPRAFWMRRLDIKSCPTWFCRLLEPGLFVIKIYWKNYKQALMMIYLNNCIWAVASLGFTLPNALDQRALDHPVGWFHSVGSYCGQKRTTCKKNQLIIMSKGVLIRLTKRRCCTLRSCPASMHNRLASNGENRIHSSSLGFSNSIEVREVHSTNMERGKLVPVDSERHSSNQ